MTSPSLETNKISPVFAEPPPPVHGWQGLLQQTRHTLKEPSLSVTAKPRLDPRRWLAFLILAALAALLLTPSLLTLSFNLWAGSLAAGLCLGFVALGVYVTFRILNFPDLTIDGSFPLGGSIAAVLITAGVNPYLTLPVAFLGGALAGIATGLIATRLKIHSLLASILTTTALISINLRVMGRSNIPLLNSESILTPLQEPFRAWLATFGSEPLLRMANNLLAILWFGVLALVLKLIFDLLMRTELGLAMRATGDNPQMIRALGTDTNRMILLGLALSNGLVGLAGALFAQYQGFADVSMGQGLIIAGLAAVILGETIVRPRRISAATLAVFLGMIVYRFAIAAALNVKLPLPDGTNFRIDATDVKLVTSLLVLGALWFTHIQKRDRRR